MMPTIEPYLVFINPEFTLYQVPLNSPIIFPTQLNRFINKLKRKSFKQKDRNIKLAEHLVAHHIKDSPYMQIPTYSYDQLEKGMTCASCNSMIDEGQDMLISCNKCGSSEDLDSAILRTIEEYRFLFPKKKITTNNIYEWCKIVKLKKTIKRVLKKNFKLLGHGRYSYYESKK
ncbi:MAG: hypothetical protein Q8934_10425 [Bacillota bacterium]|nr:hypothetical protein [Bacillota bacterium]